MGDLRGTKPYFQDGQGNKVFQNYLFYRGLMGGEVLSRRLIYRVGERNKK